MTRIFPAPPLFPSKGIAVDKNGLMYFVDATMIRKVDQNGIISTLLGANDLTAVRPLSCDSSMDVSQVRRRGVMDDHPHGPASAVPVMICQQ